MYNALIVDDEKMIRLGMRRAIPWNSIGIGEVNVARSGREALDVIREKKPEILITDIRMDDMTGLDLIDQAKHFVPEIKVIVLTGYDEFEYARQCIKLNVHDFFLKPIDEKALMESVKRQITALKTEKIGKLADINEDRARAVTEQMRIENFLRNLAYNRTNQQDIEIQKFCRQYNYDPGQYVQAAIIVPALYADRDNEIENFTALTIKNICIGMVDAQNRGLTFMDDCGRIVIAFFHNKRKGGILDWLQELNGILRDECDKRPKMVVGNPVEGIKHLNISYNDAVNLLKYEEEGNDGIIQTIGAQKKANLFREVFTEIKNAMCENIAEPDRVLSIFERFYQATDSYNVSDSYTRRCCFELASSVYYSFICHSGAEADASLNVLAGSLVNVNREELFQLTRNFLAKLLGSREEQCFHEIIKKAKRYVAEHLSDNLSVSDIASSLYITPNYLSRLFKKATGEGCNEYIVRKRIEKAKLLLETTDFKTSRIAMMVGYRDTNYFSLAVKKNTGMSPKKYREVHRPNMPGIS